MWRRRSILVHALDGRRPEPPAAVEAPLGPALSTGALEWRQAGPWWSPHWELRAEGRRVATFQPAGAFGRRIAIVTAETRWTLRSRGVFGGATLARDDDGAEALRYRPRWFRGGRIERAAESPLEWRARFFGGGGVVRNGEGFDLLEVVARRALFRAEAEVRITDAGRRLPDLAALVSLAWWLALESARSSRSAH
jgi:hypothetical protein